MKLFQLNPRINFDYYWRRGCGISNKKKRISESYASLLNHCLVFFFCNIKQIVHHLPWMQTLLKFSVILFVCLFVCCNWQHSKVSLYLFLRTCRWGIFHISWRGNEINSYLMESLSTNSSKKADSMSNVWSSFGRSVNPGIFSAQPLDMSMEAVRRL